MGLPSLPGWLQSIPQLDAYRRDDNGLPIIGNFQAAPSVAKLGELHARLSRTWNIAQAFTMIASLLNVLVILDAVSGPAERSYARPEESHREPKAA
jgi:hypothetical protein